MISVALSVATLVGIVGATPSAFAQSSADLQAQIAALLAQIQMLQSQLGSGSGSTGSYNFTTDLTLGSKGADVTALQQMLINKGFLAIAAPTGYFGSMTQAALGKFQASVGISPAAGYFGPKTRAYVNSMSGVVTPPSGGGGGVVVPSSGLSVGLASDNPVAGSLLNGAGRVPVMAVNFTAGNSGAVNLNQVKFTKTGVVSDSSIGGAYLVENGKVVAQYVSLNQGVITFSNLGLSVGAGQTRKLWLAVDVTGATAGNIVSFKLNAASDVTAADSANTAITASGAFPLMGNSLTVSTVSNPALAGLTITSSTVGSTVFAGTQNVLVSQWSASVTNSKVKLSSLKFRVTGSANKSDIQNVKLYVNGTQVGSTLTSVDASGDAYFDLTNANAVLNTGTSNLQVYADVMGSPSYTFQFQLLNSFDAYAVDTQYNSSITVTVNGGSGAVVTIQQGQLTVSLASDTPTGNLAKGQSNVTLAKFKIYAAGEAVKVKFLDFSLTFTGVTSTLTTQIKNVALVDDAGGQVGTTINTPPSSNTCTGSGVAAYSAGGVYNDCFGTSGSPINYIIPANTTRVLSLKGDIQTGATFTTVTAALTGNTSNLQGLTSSQTSNTGTVTGSSLSLAANAVTTAANSAVGTQTFTKNTANAKIGSYAVTASSAEGVVISNVTIQTGAGADVNYQNLAVKIGSTQFGTSYSTLSATTSYTFSGTQFTVPAGQTTIIDVYADVLSNAATQNGAATTLSSCTGTGSSSNSSVSCTAATGQVVTIGGSPSLTIGIDSGTAPTGQLVMGSTGNSLASFRFTETTNVEDVKITDLVIFQRVATNTANTKSSFGNLTLYDGATAVGTAGSAVASANLVTSSSGAGYNYAFHFATPVVVAKSSSKTLVLKGDVASYVSGGATDNATSTFLIGTSTEYAATSSIVTALGNSSNAGATNVLSSPVGNTQTVLRSAMTMSVAGLGSTSGRAKTSIDDIGTITFAASNAGSVSLNQVKLTITGSLPTSTFLSNNGAAADDVKLFDPSTGAVVQGTATSGACTSGGTCTFTFTIGTGTSGYVLSAGASKTFNVRVNSFAHTPAGANGVSQTLAVTVNATTDVTYVNALDGSGSSVNLPATVVPAVVNSVAYASGT
ncbi:MAG: Uncharacterized protein LiPW15_475 [Parcubacteria group bacterium LiPW_15]|nr:MAG: Uncharacterized protein LiPW15_475 [Parcubacteria group bacterium LiPW_15]